MDPIDLIVIGKRSPFLATTFFGKKSGFGTLQHFSELLPSQSAISNIIVFFMIELFILQ